MDLPPVYWGITTAEVRALIEECRLDSRWTRSTSVRTLVNDFVKPKTAGQGKGYALLPGKTAMDTPREVEVMVSHSWNEPAEEFLEALERTVSKHTVMFICAFSIFQNEDGSGPSIADQLGRTAEESPFFQVLDHISTTGASFGLRWAPRFIFKRWALNMLVLAGLVLYTPAALFFRSWTLGGLVVWDGVGWKNEGHVVLSRLMLCTSAALALVALALRVAASRMYLYRGRMVAVPNSEDDLYSRLWCVYEMFVAIEQGVHVQLAPTMASAGRNTCEAARCWDPLDEAKIRGEIQGSCGGYRAVDAGVHRMLRPQWLDWVRVKLFAMVLFIMSMVHKDPPVLLAAKAVMIVWWGFSCWLMSMRLQGRYLARHMYMQIGHLGCVSFALALVARLHGGFVAKEIAKFGCGIVAVQSVLFLADYLCYRSRPGSSRNFVVSLMCFFLGFIVCDRGFLKSLSSKSPFPSLVVFLSYLISGPFLCLGFHKLDRSFGIHWTETPDDGQSRCRLWPPWRLRAGVGGGLPEGVCGSSGEDSESDSSASSAELRLPPGYSYGRPGGGPSGSGDTSDNEW